MKTVDEIRNRLIDKILTIRNQDILLALDKILSSTKEEHIDFTEEQKVMLQMSEDDIKYGRLISEEDLDRQDEEWLEGK